MSQRAGGRRVLGTNRRCVSRLACEAQPLGSPTVISDVHANLETLMSLPESGDELWVLGELAGYGRTVQVTLPALVCINEKAVPAAGSRNQERREPGCLTIPTR
jgi:hypothetical protein